MYRLDIDKKKAYKYNTRNGEFDYYLDGDIIHVSTFSSEKRAERLVQLAHVYKLASGSRRMVTRAMMILLAKGFETKRLADRVVRQVGPPQEIGDIAQSILTEYFYNRVRVSLPLLSDSVARRLIGKAVFPPNCPEREDFPRKDLKNDAIAKKREDTAPTLAPTPPLAKSRVATLLGIEVPRRRPRVIQSPEIDELSSNVDEIEMLKRLANQLEKENEELEKKYDSQKNAKRVKLTEKVKSLKEKKKRLQSKLAALSDEFDTEEDIE